MAACFINNGIGKPPAQTGRIGTEDRIHIGGNLIFDGLKILQHPASRPVDIRSLLENYVDEGTAEIGKPSDCLYLRGGKEGGRNRVGDLVFHQIGASARPFGVDDNLSITQIRKSIEGRILQSPVTPGKGKDHHQKNDEFIACAEFNDFSDHKFFISACAGVLCP